MGFNPFIGGGASEDKVARAEIAAIKDGETLDSFSDVENALANKADIADIPTVPITTIQKNGTNIMPVDGTVNIIVPTTAADVSALPDTIKYATALNLTINSQTFVITGQLKDQNGDNLGTTQTIDLPLESVVVDGSYDNQTKKVILTLQNGNTVEFSVADLVSGLQTELSESNKLNPAYINYNSTHRAVSDTEKSTWNGKQNALSSTQLSAVDSGIDSLKVTQITTNTDSISEQRVALDEDRAALVELVDGGAKNLLKITVASKTIGGVTFTVNDDGTVTVDGTNTGTGSVSFMLVSNQQANLIPDGGYWFSGCPQGGGTDTFDLRWYRYTPNVSAYDTGSGVAIHKNGNTTDSNIAIVVRPGVTVNNITFKPMLCTKAAWDISQKFVPYKSYIDVNGVRLYVSSTVPTGDIPDGSIGIGW